MINNEKTALIKSMNNLIKHITSSKQSQQEIFESLQLKDFQKIINNLADPIRELRLTSALLIGLLLHDSEIIQKSFCSTMNIHFSNDSEVIFNNNFDNLMSLFPSKVTQIIKLLKTHNKSRVPSSIKPWPLIWLINPEKKNLSIQYLSKQQIQDLIKINQANLNPEDLSFDPLNCIFGICIVSSVQNTLKQKSTQNTQLSDSRDLNSKKNEKIVPQNFRPQIVFSQQVKDYSALKRQSPIQNYYNTNQIHTCNNGPVYRVDTYKNQPNYQERQQLSAKKISLTENKRKKIDQPSVIKFVYENPHPNLIKSCEISKTRREQSFPPNMHYSGHYPRTIDQVSYSTPIRSTYGHSQQINRAPTLVAPSIKVKNIAINGRLGWQSTKNNGNIVFHGNPTVY